MNKLIFYIIILFIYSCTKSFDGTKPKGYPFVGEMHEVNFRLFDKNKFGYGNPQYSKTYSLVADLKVVDNQIQCDSIVKKNCLPCNCDTVDFNKESIYHIKNSIGNVYDGGFETRVLLNHKNKTLGVESRIYYTTGSSGLNSVYKTLYYDEWLIIPKPPKGYTFKEKL